LQRYAEPFDAAEGCVSTRVRGTPTQSCATTSPHSQQDVDRKLIEPLILQSALRKRCAVEGLAQQRLRVLARVSSDVTCGRSIYFGQNLTNLFVSIPALGLLSQDEISPHTSASEVFHSCDVFCAVSVGVEVA